MIERTLVPRDARLPAAADLAASARRRPTTMDERTLVPAMLPIVTLNGHSNIPTNLPLQSIAARVVVPRDIQREAYSVVEDDSIPLQVTEMDQRIAVPQNSAPPEPNVKLPVVDTELVDPDIFMTGEVHLIASPPSPEKARADLITRISSVVLHVALIAVILLQAKLFPKHEPTAEEVDIARKQLTLLLPPGAFESCEAVVETGTAPACGTCGSAGAEKSGAACCSANSCADTCTGSREASKGIAKRANTTEKCCGTRTSNDRACTEDRHAQVWAETGNSGYAIAASQFAIAAKFGEPFDSGFAERGYERSE